MLVRDRRGAEGVATGLSCPYGIPPPLPLGGFGVGVYVTSALGGIREIWGLLFRQRVCSGPMFESLRALKF